MEPHFSWRLETKQAMALREPGEGSFPQVCGAPLWGRVQAWWLLLVLPLWLMLVTCCQLQTQNP